MKRTLLTIIAVSLIASFGCFNDSKDNSNSMLLLGFAGGGGGGSISSQNIYINDANGEIGRALMVMHNIITMYSSNNYMYIMKWDGTFLTQPIYFSESSCTGTAYVYRDSLIEYPSYGKFALYGTDSKLYRYKTVNEDGTSSIISISYESIYDSGMCSALSGTTDASELEETTRASVGIPATITPPLSVVFK